MDNRPVHSPLAPSTSFTPISPAYRHVLRLRALVTYLPLAAIFVGLAVWLRQSLWMWVPVVLAVLALVAMALQLWLGRRHVRAIGYVLGEEDLLVCRGVLVRELEVVPYGRMQQVTVAAGPFLRRFGLAAVQMQTASSMGGAAIPGLEVADAEQVRTTLTKLGTAQMEGL